MWARKLYAGRRWNARIGPTLKLVWDSLKVTWLNFSWYKNNLARGPILSELISCSLRTPRSKLVVLHRLNHIILFLNYLTQILANSSLVFLKDYFPVLPLLWSNTSRTHGMAKIKSRRLFSSPKMIFHLIFLTKNETHFWRNVNY